MPQVSIPIIDQLAHPSIGLLTRVALPANPYAGPFQAFVPPVTLLAITYGIYFRVHTVPPQWGRDISFPVQYSPPFAKASVTYTDLSGILVIRQVTHIDYDDQDLFWDEPLPTTVNIYIQPGWTLDLFWAQT